MTYHIKADAWDSWLRGDELVCLYRLGPSMFACHSRMPVVTLVWNAAVDGRVYLLQRKAQCIEGQETYEYLAIRAYRLRPDLNPAGPHREIRAPKRKTTEEKEENAKRTEKAAETVQ